MEKSFKATQWEIWKKFTTTPALDSDKISSYKQCVFSRLKKAHSRAKSPDCWCVEVLVQLHVPQQCGWKRGEQLPHVPHPHSCSLCWWPAVAKNTELFWAFAWAVLYCIHVAHLGPLEGPLVGSSWLLVLAGAPAPALDRALSSADPQFVFG